MEIVKTRESTELKVENLKWGVPDINTDHSLEEAIKFMAQAKELEGLSIKIECNSSPARREIVWSDPPNEHHPISWINTAFITSYPEQEGGAGVERMLILPEYLLVIERKLQGDRSNKPSALSLFTKGSLSSFSTKVQEVLGYLPGRWKITSSNAHR